MDTNANNAKVYTAHHLVVDSHLFAAALLDTFSNREDLAGERQYWLAKIKGVIEEEPENYARWAETARAVIFDAKKRGDYDRSSQEWREILDCLASKAEVPVEPSENDRAIALFAHALGDYMNTVLRDPVTGLDTVMMDCVGMTLGIHPAFPSMLNLAQEYLDREAAGTLRDDRGAPKIH